MGHLLSRWKVILLIVIAFAIIGGGFFYYYQQGKQIGVLRVDAGARNSETFFLLNQLSEVVERNSSLIRLELIEGEELNGNHSLELRQGVDLTTMLSHRPALPNTHLIAGLYEEAFQLITRKDTDIHQIPDLEGKKLALPPHGSSELAFFWAIGDHYNLFAQNVSWEAMSEEQALKALLDKSIDAIFFVGSVRNRATLKLVEEFDLLYKSPGLRMLAVDQAAAMQVKRPYIEVLTIERGTFDGSNPLPNRPIKTGAVRRLLVATANANADHIAELTRVLFEHRSDLLVRFPLANRIQAPDVSTGLTLPLHEGANRYYSRNEPSFIQENAEPLALLVTVVAMLSSVLFALRSRFVATQKNLADQFNYDVLAIGKRVRDTGSPADLKTCREDLVALLDVAVRALDIDEVTDGGFQSFAFLWKTVNSEIDERLIELKKSTNPRA